MSEIMGKIEVTIKGLSPLLMSRLNIEDLKQKTIKRMMVFNPEEDAEKSAYIDVINGKKQLYIPNEAIYRCLLNASKMRRTGRIPLSSILAGSIRIEPDKIPLGTDKYQIDVRPVVIQKSKILKARPRLDQWSASFTILYRKSFLSQVIEVLKDVLSEAGLRYGLLSYRPQRGGFFGTFSVEKFEVIS